MAMNEGKLEDTFDRARGIPSRKSWRPDGWKNPNKPNYEEPCYPYDLFEAGADAMLAKLRHQKYSIEHIYDEDKNHKGVRVFIPDDA